LENNKNEQSFGIVMELIDKFNIVKQNAVEILTEDELKELLKSKKI